MKYNTNRQLINITQLIIAILVWLPTIFMLTSCDSQFGTLSEDRMVGKQEEDNTHNNPITLNFDEVIVFCGNPGVGKSTLCNSIFQEPIFPSGFSVFGGMTEHQQEHIHQHKLYVDTPGLDNPESSEKAAKEIEKALKHNNNYKIVFVTTMESGRIRPADLATINVVSDAIKTQFEYGLVFNKVSKAALEEQSGQSDMKQALVNRMLNLLHKRPSSVVVLQEDMAIKDRNNKHFQEGDKNRQRLLSFLDGLKANSIQESAVGKIDVADFQAKVKEIEKRHQLEMKALRKEMEAQKQTMEEQKQTIEKERATYNKVTKKLKEEQEKRDKEYEGNLKKIQGDALKSKTEQETEINKLRNDYQTDNRKYMAQQEELKRKLEAAEEKNKEFKIFSISKDDSGLTVKSDCCAQ